MAYRHVAHIDDFADPDTRGFDLDPNDETKRLFVVRDNGRFYAYLNSCPHTGGPLNWRADRFLSKDGGYIQCALHGAMFRIHDGCCIAGPCTGDALTPLPVHIDNGRLMVELPGS
jgi:nitrite reductase/ring-hydroxylating ferredoxin subunit